MGTFTSLPREAIKGTGGIQYAILCNWTDVSTAIDGSTGIASFTPNTSTNWQKFTPRKESSDFTETMVGTPASGISNYKQEF